MTGRATSFGTVAAEYDRWRPSYPAAAVDWLAPPTPGRVAELGAGTGKLTRLLLLRGLEVEVVEPDPRMLAVLVDNNPAARPHASDSTHIPVEDESLDAVLVADAWHWFDPEPTIAEVRRVLRPGGWLGLVWNVVAEPVAPWEQALAEDSGEYDRITKATDAGLGSRLSYLPEDELEYRRFAWEWQVTPEEWASFKATTSMAIAMSPEERAASAARSQAALQQACEALGTTSVPVRHLASCVRWTPAG